MRLSYSKEKRDIIGEAIVSEKLHSLYRHIYRSVQLSILREE